MTGSQAFRLSSGGRIDRNRPLRFTFDGRALTGFEGDTLASALLANGVRVVGRSFKFHRPRGVFSAGPEEPNALVTVGTGAYRETAVRATMQPLYEGLTAAPEHCWPSLSFDVGRVTDWLHALFPAGFYNKTFMWPGWSWYEPVVRRSARIVPPPVEPDPDGYETCNASCDVLVVGAGPCGMLAALAATRAGARVLLVEQDTELGGSLLAERAVSEEALKWWQSCEAELRKSARVLTRSTVVGFYDHLVLTVHERVALKHGPEPAPVRERFWRVRAKAVVLATGATEQPLVFPYNDLPGILLSGAVRQYANRFAVLAGRRVAVATNNDLAYRAAIDLLDAGAEIAAVLDSRPAADGPLARLARERGIDVRTGQMIDSAQGRSAVKGIRVGRPGERPVTLECDCIAVSGGWNPTLHLLMQAGGRLTYDPTIAGFVPAQVPESVTVIGGAAGIFDAPCALREAIAAGKSAAAAAGHHGTVEIEPPAIFPATDYAPAGECGLRGEKGRARAWVDLRHDVTVQDIDIAIRENFVSVEHLKRYTTTGMAADQGKTSTANAVVMLAQATNRSVDATGTPRSRPPFMPVTLGAIAGGRLGRFYKPVRELPTHDVQRRLGAVMEDFGGWMRPAVYLRDNESEHDAIQREVRSVRAGVGIMDASPLGKILVRGPDAARFLERIYANPMAGLAVGKVRYGIMLNEKGVIIDDGVCARLGEDEYWVSTTSSGASRIATWLEEWLQCEWTDLRVVTTPVTPQWATITVAGPRSREVMRKLDSDIDFGPDSFPHMSARSGTLLGLPCRVFRVSFTGELSYEVNVPAGSGLALWQALMDAGRDFGIVPFGVEALMTMRIEKGFMHVGADTDGTTIPADVGFGVAVAGKSGDFVGRRSLSLPEHVREDRMQLVGLEARDSQPLTAGAHIVERSSGVSGLRTQGYVTSTCFSPTLGRYIGLGLLERGSSRIGETVTVMLGDARGTAHVVPRTHLDPAGERVNA